MPVTKRYVAIEAQTVLRFKNYLYVFNRIFASRTVPYGSPLFGAFSSFMRIASVVFSVLCVCAFRVFSLMRFLPSVMAFAL
jgi:hypothetical protein